MAIISRVRRLAIAALLTVGAACHGLLDVSDPTRITDDDVANASGANAKRLNASYAFSNAGPLVAREVAEFTDEWTYDFPSSANILVDRDALLDKREGSLLQALLGGDQHLGLLDAAYVQSGIAIAAVRAYTPDSLQGDFLGQLYAIRGYAVLQMAEDLCPGFPVNDVVDKLAVYGGPLTTDSAIALASAQLDSAIKYVRDSTRFNTLARVAKGRALIDQGQYTDAASIVASVPTSSVYTTEQNVALAMGNYSCDGCRITGVGEHEGGNGLPFVSAADPRIPTLVRGVRNTNTNDTLYYTTKGMATTDRIVLASGTEARLIQAEAALHGGLPDSATAILNTLRSTVPGLSSLTTPGSTSAQVDTLYKERAFWLYMTGRRLGDLRRLVTQYGRGAETVFPTGTYDGGSGGLYGTATSIPFIASDQQQYNPHITTGCSSM